MWFDAWVGPALVFAGLIYGATRGNKPDPWKGVGTRASVAVVNQTALGPLYVTCEAPAVDRQARPLGFVEPYDSVVFNLPYAGAHVTVRVEDLASITMNVDAPRRWLVVVAAPSAK